MKRYVFRRLIPYAAVLAVAFGVFSLISVLAVMEGFKEEMRDRIRGSLSHLAVFGRYTSTFVGADDAIAMIQDLDHVEAAAPYITAPALYKANTVSFCELRGIDPLAEAKVGDFASFLLRQSEWERLIDDESATLPDSRMPLTDAEIKQLFSLERRRRLSFNPFSSQSEGFGRQSPPQPIVVGIEALRRNQTRIGDIMELTSFSPRDQEVTVQTFLVVGAFRTGVFEQDEKWIFTPIQAAIGYLNLFDEDLFDDRITGISIRLDDYRFADEVRRNIETDVAPKLLTNEVVVKTWEDQRRNLLRAVEIEKRIISVMMLLIVLFAGIMIFLILTLMVIEKTRDLGVLRSLGATRRGVITLFLRQGLALTLLGIVVGSIAGVILVQNINEIHDAIKAATGWSLFPPDVYYLSRIPTKMRFTDWSIVLGPALAFGYLGSLIPALWAARRDPVKALHHE